MLGSFLSGAFSRVKGLAGRALGTVGGVVRKFGDMAGTATRLIGQIGTPLSSVVSTVADAAGAPEIGALVNKGISFLGGPGQSVAAKISHAGDALQAAGGGLMAR